MRLAFLHRHEKFRRQVDAYLDSELPAAGVARFESHLAGCFSCAAAVQEGRELKVLFAALQPVEAPRSFRLTPAMVAAAAPARPQPARQPAMALRFAQVTAGVAIMALATVAAIDFAGGNSDSDEQTMMATGSAESAKSAPLAQDAAGGTSGVAREPASPPVLPTPIGGSAGAQSNATQAVPTADTFSKNQPGNAATPGASGTNSYANPYGAADAFRPAASRSSGGDSGPSALRLAELGLLALAASAAASWLLLARRSRRS